MEEICEQIGVTGAEFLFLREQNPLHYGRKLEAMGFSHENASEIAHWYNEMVFKPVIEIYKRMQGEYKDDVRE